MNARLIAADDPAWDACLGADADAHARAAYARAAAAAAGAAAVLAVVDDGGAAIAVPLLLRPIPGGPHRDAESPPGYAGIVCRGVGPWEPLWSGFAELLRGIGAVNAFVRADPFAEQPALAGHWRPGGHRLRTVPLGDGAEAAFAGSACATQRSQVHRAAQAGLRASVRAAPAAADLADFRRIYDGTMQRLDAEDGYRFGDAYYAELRGLGEALAAVEVRDGGGRLHAACLVLAGTATAHYHLSGRAADAHNAASHLMLDAAARWAAGRGCRRLNLGGGRRPDGGDPLFAFKARIGRGEALLRTAGIVCDPAAHAALVAAAGPDATWFQAYRQPRGSTP